MSRQLEPPGHSRTELSKLNLNQRRCIRRYRTVRLTFYSPTIRGCPVDQTDNFHPVCNSTPTVLRNESVKLLYSRQLALAEINEPTRNEHPWHRSIVLLFFRGGVKSSR